MQVLAFSDLRLPLLGGFLLAISSTTLLAGHGRVLGCSGALHSVLTGKWDPIKAGVTCGIVAGGLALGAGKDIVEATLGSPLGDEIAPGIAPLLILGSSGFLSGLGTRLGSGCTSGHMLCGMARGSVRSIAATAMFFPTALLTRRLLGPLMPRIYVLGSAPSAANPRPILTGGLLAAPLTTYFLLCRMTSKPLTFFRALLLGATFSFGLAVSGMSRPTAVLGFFDFGLHSFDPALFGVAIAGLGTNTIAFFSFIRPRLLRWSASRKNYEDNLREGRLEASWSPETPPPLAQEEGWQLPELVNATVDFRLLLGSLLFGISWGAAGVCPGPGLFALGVSLMSRGPWVWVIGFALGGRLG